MRKILLILAIGNVVLGAGCNGKCFQRRERVKLLTPAPVVETPAPVVVEPGRMDLKRPQ